MGSRGSPIARLAQKILLVIVLFSLSYQSASCGDKKGWIDPAFSSYIEDFEKKVGVKVVGLNIRFEPTQYPIIGLCAIGGELNEITIDPVFWFKMDTLGRELLMYHELGHCLLLLGHDDRRVVLDGVKVEGSIMYPYWFGDKPHYAKYRENYKLALRRGALVSSFSLSVVDLVKP